MIYKLLKVLYDLKQSLYFWYKKLLSFFFEKLGLKQINADYNMVIIKTNLDSLVISTIIDDIKSIVPNESWMVKQVKSKHISIFLIIDMGPISFYLDLKVD